MTQLESLLKLKQAMKENKSKAFVYERWQDYDDKYKELAGRNSLGLLDKREYREVFLNYIRYISKNGDNEK